MNVVQEYRREGLISQKTNLVLSSAHPSPFAAMKGFFGNGHFNQANTWLEGKYGPKGGVDWASLGAQA
jgi:uracil-DNA glycosylase